VTCHAPSYLILLSRYFVLVPVYIFVNTVVYVTCHAPSYWILLSRSSVLVPVYMHVCIYVCDLPRTQLLDTGDPLIAC